MKIHKLTLKNINSLYGEWSIDFDNEAYCQNGIFGIVGNTGAGKTTLLDAICLAIYRETPRLGKITKSSNALMSVDTYECKAIVELSLTHHHEQKRYRFSFAQNRSSRGKYKGQLQEPTHEISLQNEKGEFKPISEKKSDSEKLAIELLGMSFSQFTRSVLLAQGGFSAFLKAEPNERGQILEKITGTEIYATIGKKVAEKHKKQKQLLEEKKIKLSEVNIMSDDELSSLKSYMDNSQKTKKELDKKISTIDIKIKQYSQYHDLSSNIQTNQQKLSDIEQELVIFLPKLQQLNQAKHYNVILPIFNHLNSIKAKNDEINHQFVILQQQLHDEKIKFNDYQVELMSVEQELNNYRSNYEYWQPKIDILRQLNHDLDKLINESHFVQNTLMTQNDNCNKLSNKIKQTNHEIEQLNHEISNDEFFLKKYFSITNINANLLTTNVIQFNHELDKLLNKISELKQKQHKIISLKDEQEALNIKSINELSMPIEKIEEYLQSLSNELNDMNQYMNDFEIFNHHFGQLYNKQLSEQQKQAELANTNTALTRIQQDFDVNETTLRQLILEYELLEKNYRLSDELSRLRDFFEALTEGEPCPLCGSEHHPYVHNPPMACDDIDELKQKLNHKKQAMQTLQTKQKENELQLIELHASIKHQIQQLDELNVNICHDRDRLIFDWQLLSNKINNTMEFYQLADETLTHLKENFLAKYQYKKEYYEIIKKIFEQYQENKKKIKEYYDEWKIINADILPIFITLEIEKSKLSEIFDNYGLIIGELSKNNIDDALIKKLFSDIDVLKQLYDNGLKTETLPIFYQNYEILNDNMDNIKYKINNMKEQFLTAIDYYNKKNNEYTQNKSALNYHKNNLIIYQKDFDDNMQILNKLNNDLNEINQKIEILLSKKLQDFGDISADEKEKELLSELQQCQDEFTHKKQKLILREQRINDLINRIDEYAIKLKESEQELIKIQEHFNHKLSEKFHDMEHFLNAKLSNDDMDILENNHQQLIEKQTNLKIILKQYQKQFDELLMICPDIDEWRSEVLNLEQQQLKNQLEHLLTEFGTNQAKYDQAIDNLQKMTMLMNDIKHMEQEFIPLQKLNALIGKNEGKDYRNFAQSLTLTALLNEANQELQKMDKRYLLVANGESKLDIDVIDTYQGDKIRQSKNLSGGESFLVSLALALGLSKMSSQKMQIDSLFLDEGFGTLDEEALEMALNALSDIGLEGKMIGVISHVEALKERLNSKIMVSKQSGGVSVLSGVGVIQTP